MRGGKQASRQIHTSSSVKEAGVGAGSHMCMGVSVEERAIRTRPGACVPRKAGGDVVTVVLATLARPRVLRALEYT